MLKTGILFFWIGSYIIIGMGLFLFPSDFMKPYGLVFDTSGAFMARVLGSFFLSMGLLLYLSRSASFTDKHLKNLFIVNCLFNLLDASLGMQATSIGTMNGLGWISVATHLTLAISFGIYIGLKKQKPNA